MRVLVTGDRNWSDLRRIIEVLDAVHAQTPVSLLIEGCASGADQLAGDHRHPAFREGPGDPGFDLAVDPGWAWARRVPGAHYPADWRRYGRGAGPVRNRQMLDAKPDLVIAFHNDLANSKGTRDMVRKAHKAGIPVRLFTSVGEVIVR